VGSRSKTHYAYIAGFLDGDGSLMLQVKKRKDGKRGWRFMASIVFYQDSRHDMPLFWIRKILGIGYISKRKDGITELRIQGFKQIERILKILMPHIRFKYAQARSLLNAVMVLNRIPIERLKQSDREKIREVIITIQEHNYQSPRKKTRAMLSKILDLTP